MSTGDQSQYVRSKLAERGSTRGAKFMKDGFDTWAESEAPAREGQMSKIPSEIMEDNYGGAMTVRHAKKMLHGGSALSDAVDAAKKIVNFWREASKFIDDFDEELEYQIIRGPRSSPGLKKFARDLRDVIAGIRTSKSMLDGVAALAGTVGLGKNGQMRGGMTMQEAGQYISQIMGWFKFLVQAYNNVMAILEMESFKFLKPQITNAFNMIKGAVGLGRRGGASFESCDAGWIDDGLTCRKPIDCKVSQPSSMFEIPTVKCSGGEVVAKKMKKGGRRRGGAETRFEPCDEGWIDDGLLCRKPLNCKQTSESGFPMVRCSGGEVVPKKMTKGGRRVGGGLAEEMMAQHRKTMEKLDARQRLMQEQADLENKFAMERSQAERAKAMENMAMMAKGGRRGGYMPSVAEMHKIRLPAEVSSTARQVQKFMGGRRVGSGLVDDLMMEQKKRAMKAQGGRLPDETMMVRKHDKGGRSCGGRKPSARGAIVKQVMQQHGLSLPQASKYVKEHGLY